MKTIKIWNDSPSDRQLDEIASRLKDGEIMVYPTDTLYAVGCNALDLKAVERICRIKGINPEKTNLSVICDSIATAAKYARIDNSHFMMLRRNTPGPFTFLFRTASTLPKAFKNRKIVGIRIPDNATARGIVEHCGFPLLSTSVEFEDDDYTINPELIAEEAEGIVDFCVDGGEGGTEESTVVDCTGAEAEIIREGKGTLI